MIAREQTALFGGWAAGFSLPRADGSCIHVLREPQGAGLSLGGSEDEHEAQGDVVDVEAWYGNRCRGLVKQQKNEWIESLLSPP